MSASIWLIEREDYDSLENRSPWSKCVVGWRPTREEAQVRIDWLILHGPRYKGYLPASSEPIQFPRYKMVEMPEDQP